MSSDFETNLQDAEKLLGQYRNDTLPHFIDGKRDAARNHAVARRDRRG